MLTDANYCKLVWRRTCFSNYHDIYFKYLIILYVSYTSMKLKLKKKELLEIKEIGLEMNTADPWYVSIYNGQ